MGTGYTRNDTANNIADGNVINASDLDGEFDAIQAAFNATTGHSHDGTTGEGPQIGTTGIADNAVTLGTKTTGNYVAAGAVSGVGLSGSASSEGATFTVTSNATSANTASTIVARDASGNFSAGQITGTAFVSTGDMTFGDGDKAIFGAGSDLQIYHEAVGDSVISESGVGSLKILADDFYIRNAADTQRMIRCIDGGLVGLYYAGSEKLATTSGGIDVTGTVVADKFTIDGIADFENNSNSLQIQTHTSGTGIVYDAATGYHTFKRNTTNALQINGGTGDIYFYDSTGVTQGFYWDASTQRLGLSTTTPQARLEVEDNGSGNPLVKLTQDDQNLWGLVIGNDTYSTTDTDGLRFNVENGGVANISASAGMDLSLGVNSDHLYITSGGSVGIGESNPQYKVDVNGPIRLANGNWLGFGTMGVSGANTFIGGTSATNDFYIYTANNERLRINSSGNVGIGTSSPNRLLSLYATQPVFQITNVASGNTQGTIQYQVSGDTQFNIDNQGSGSGGVIAFMQAGSERMRLDTSGNLLVGKTSANLDTVGAELRSNGIVGATVSGGAALWVNRTTDDGDIAIFSKDGTTVGSIGSYSGATMYLDGAGNRTGIQFATGFVGPRNNGALADNAADLGSGSYRFKDLYLSGEATVGTAVASTNTASKAAGSHQPDMGTYQNFVWTLTGNITLSNQAADHIGQTGFFVFIQDGTGTRTVSLGTAYETVSGGGLTLSSAGGSTDIVPYVYAASGRILLGTPQLAFS